MMVNGEERGNGVVCGDVACCGSGFGICAVHPQKGVEINLVLNTEVHFVVPAHGHETIRDL